MTQFIINASLNHAKKVYWALALLTFGLMAFIPTIQIDTDPENMLPTEQVDRVFHNQIKKEFNLYDPIVVGVVNTQNENGIYNTKTLSEIHALTEAVFKIEGVVQLDVMALSTSDNITQEGPGTIRFEWMMNNPPKTELDASAIKSKVQRLPLMLDTLVSSDGKAASIYVPILDKNESYRISEEIKDAITSLNLTEQFHITGLPVAEDTFGFDMFVQMGISAPMAAVMIFLLMLLFFRNLSFVTAPMIVAMATVISTMGLLIACGFTVHIMSSMIAIFLMPIAVVDSIHIMSEFSDRYKPGSNAKEVAKEVVGHLFTPMLYTSVTSAIGFLSLALTPIPPVQVFGVFVGFGIFLAFLITVFFIPAYISRMSKAQLIALQQKMHKQEGKGMIVKLLPKLGTFSVNKSKYILIGFISVFIFSLVGIQKIQINDNPIRWFKSDHEIRVADKVLNEHFAGTYDAFLTFTYKEMQSELSQLKTIIEQYAGELTSSEENLVNQIASLESMTSTSVQELSFAVSDRLFEANENDVAVLEKLLARLEAFQSQSKFFTQPDSLRYIEKMQKALVETGLVGKSNALTDLVKTVNRELQGGEQVHYVIPDSQNAVAQTLLQFQSSHRPQDLWHMVNPDFSRTLVWIQLTSGDNQDMSKVMDAVNQFVKANPLPEAMEMQWAGKTYINVVWQDAMVSGMLDSLTSAFVVVFVMMVILFRSVIFGLLAMLPLTVTITFIYGLIGWLGKDYDMPIAVLSALTLGLSVDFAIHFIERTRAIFAETQSYSKTINLMFNEPGRAITRNAIVIAIGFTPLLFAPLVPYITVGFFLASIMALSAIATLILLPATFSLLKSFIFNNK